VRVPSFVWPVALLLWLAFSASAGLAASSPDIVEKKLEFPWPIQWKVNNVIEVSLVAVALGPANSPDMASKGADDVHVTNPAFFPDRPYVIALQFQAKMPRTMSAVIGAQSGLGLVKDVSGNLEAPMELTPQGFVPFSGGPGVFDLRFHHSPSTEYWDLFPVPADQTEFLFEVMTPSGIILSGGSEKLSFRIIRTGDDFRIIDETLGPTAYCLKFKRSFSGHIGADSAVNWQLTRENTSLSGTEQYTRIGKTLWLQGTVDSLGNLEIKENYPENRETGIFKGSFSEQCQTITGFFSKPDGSRLLPFELRVDSCSRKSVQKDSEIQ
jgi:hypothetical protein